MTSYNEVLGLLLSSKYDLAYTPTVAKCC